MQLLCESESLYVRKHAEPAIEEEMRVKEW